ncbi:MAG: translation initiation factor IF-5A [Candidatus Micrarchaeaceae archaeon]
MSDAITYASMKELKIGRYVLIEDIPCKVVDIEVSAPGKHGSAKMRITAIGIFNGQKKTLLKPSDADVEVPIIDKKKAQVVSIEGDTVQLMDLNTYEVYSVPMIDEFRGKLKSGNEVEVLEAMGKRALSRILTE